MATIESYPFLKLCQRNEIAPPSAWADALHSTPTRLVDLTSGQVVGTIDTFHNDGALTFTPDPAAVELWHSLLSEVA